MAFGGYDGPVYYLGPVQGGVYPFNYRWFSAGDLRVAFEDDDGALGADLAYGADYTVDPSGYSAAGGSVTLLAAVPAGTRRVLIDVDTAPGQDTSLKASEQPHERMVDRQAMILQEQVHDTAGVTVAVTDVSFAWETPKRRRIEIGAATVSQAGVLTAADKARLDSLVNNGAATLDPAAFASAVQAEATVIDDPEVTYLRTAGRAAPGDGGAGLFRKTVSEPAHPGKLQSADGAWWERVPEYRVQDYRAFGTGVAAINDAMVYLNATGGGEVLIPDDVTISGQMVAKDEIDLHVPRGVTVTLDTDLGDDTAMVHGQDVPGFRIRGGGRLDVQGNASHAVKIEGASRHPIDGLEVIGHKTGVRIEANATSGVGRVRINGLDVHDNFVHPTAPATLSKAGHALSITCRPYEGGDLTDEVVLEDVYLAGVAAGATDGLNQYTKDLCSVQGAKILWINRFQAIRSGEVGLSASFGCQTVIVRNAVAEEADGHGIILTGVHYRIDISGISGGPFQVGETVQGGTSLATGVIEYLHADHLWLQSPSREKIQKGENIQGGASLATATVDDSFYARKLEVHRSVRTRGNGIDVHDIADYAGVTAQHVEMAFIEGTHVENKPFGIIVNSTDYQLGDYHCPVGTLQTKPFNDVGASVFLGKFLSPIEITDLYGETGNSQNYAGAIINGARQIEAVQDGAPVVKLNRTGSATGQFGDVLQIARAGVTMLTIGTDGIQFPQNAETAAFSHSTLPAAADVPRKLNFSTSSRGGGAALVRSDGTRQVDLVSGLPSRSSAWDKTAIEAETGTIAGGAAYTPDGDDGHPALSVWDGAGWRHMALRPAAGTATIADATTFIDVTFTTARDNADYAVTHAAQGNEDVWVTNKAASGFRIERSGSSGALEVDWAITQHANP